MKKKEIFAISILSLLVFVSIANVSVAAPPSYVGVKNGDQFIWRASVNLTNVNLTAIALFGLENWTYMYEYFFEYFENNTGMAFDFLAGAGMKAVMVNVSDEIPMGFPGMFGSGLYFDFYVAYAENDWELVSEAANYTYPMISVLDPSLLNETTIMYGFMGSNFIMPIGFNYTMYAEVYQAMIDSSPMAGNVTLAAKGIGLEFTLKAAYFEYMVEMMSIPFTVGTFYDGILTLRWNSIGVFDYASFEYNGLTLATAWLETDGGGDEIPGFEIATIIGVSLVTILAVIYIRRKKNA